MGEEVVSDDEFHETLEDIAGSPSEDDWSLSAFHSKFSVWTDSPHSIQERRQRFFQQKGLKSSRSSSGESFAACRVDEHVKPTCEKCEGERLTQECAHVENGEVESPGTEVEGIATTSSLAEKASDHALDVSDNEESFSDGESGFLSASGGQKACDCGGDCVHEECGGLVDNLKKEVYTESLEDGLRSQHRASSSQEQLFFETDPGIPDVLVEERLKIRDLDSGKEFLMKRFNHDGSLNMLQEVATGKDMTVAEFEKILGLFSPVAQELHRRERCADNRVSLRTPDPHEAPRVTKRKSWLKRLTGALKTKERKGGSSRSVATYDSLDDTDASSAVESLSGGGSPKRDSSFAGLDRSELVKRGSVATEGLDSFWRKPQKVKVKLRQKSARDLSDLHLSQEIVAHQGAIWTMKFSPDGRYLASAGQDRVVHVWEVVDHPLLADSDHWDDGDTEGSCKGEKDGSGKGGSGRSGRGTPWKQKSGSNRSKGPVPKLFWLSEKPLCSFRGHTDDILDLSWSRSQFLLSSSMDKTVRLWHISYDECLRIFSHNDYVTCAQFNPLDDRYFLSGSLDDKVRIWSIPEHHVVDWDDLQEMVTAVSYTPDGKKAIVGSYKGTCRFYNASGNKLQLEAHIDVREENKKARGKKITGLHCMPGDPQKVLVTSNDSRVRVYDGLNLVAKYKGLRNVKSQISSSFSPTGDFIISASEDSRVLVWNSTNRDVSNKTYIYRRDKQLSCEEFTSRHVSVAIAWPTSSTRMTSSRSDEYGSGPATSEPEASQPHEEAPKSSVEHSKCPSYCLGRSPLGIFGSGRKNSVAVADELTSTKPVDAGKHGGSPTSEACGNSPPHFPRRPSFFPECGPKGSATTWPEEKLAASTCGTVSTHGGETPPSLPSLDLASVSPAWGLVIVTAGLGGEITTFQNYGFPVRL